MLTTQFYGSSGASGFYGASGLYGAHLSGASFYGFHDYYNAGFGAIQSTPATAALQKYLVSVKKLPADKATGVMNDATMAVIFNLLIEGAATVSKIPLLPQDVRDGINTVVTALKDADKKIRDITFGQASLSTVISQFTNIQAAVRVAGNAISSGAGDTAADAMLKARDAVYNAVAGKAALIQKAIPILIPGLKPATTTQFTIRPDIAQMVIGSKFVATTAKPPTGAVKPGTIYALSKKLTKAAGGQPRYRIAVPRGAGLGFGSIGVMEDGAFGNCIFGDCGLGQTAPLVESTPPGGATTPPVAPGRSVTETELEKQTGTLPFFKKPLFWVAVVGGAAAVGGGYYYMRRRKGAAPTAAPAKAAY